MIILAAPGDDGMRRIDEISDEYKSRFGQESVLRVVDETCDEVSLIYGCVPGWRWSS